ncbi:MAG: hypothetical protein HOC74_17755 [Gemmatimonadetes bacterium]|jgi:hypothetical protein|nr:hypothetical protein [Gemmatimonadota bacterium]
MAKKKAAAESTNDDESTDLSFDPGSQVELDVEENCCVTGEPVECSFSRFPDYVKGTMMVMSRKVMLDHLRNGTSIQKFKEVLVERHGDKVLEECYSNY